MSEPTYKYLIGVEVQRGEVYLTLHQNKTLAQVVSNNQVCFALTPENALELAKGMIDVAYTGRIIDKSIAKVELDLKDEEEN